MKIINHFHKNLPEYLLLSSVLFYWLNTVLFNPIAIILAAILIFQIIYKKRTLGMIISGILILACCYMVLALFSELREFPVFNSEAKELLFYGLLYLTSTFAVAGIMLFKYSKTIRN